MTRVNSIHRKPQKPTMPRRVGFTLVELPFGRLSSSLSLRAEGRTTQHGFTLVELLVVVAIISLLIAILLPALKKAREVAEQVKCGATLKQISMAVINYTMENGQYIPSGYSDNRYDDDGNKLRQIQQYLGYQLYQDKGALYGNPKQGNDSARMYCPSFIRTPGVNTNGTSYAYLGGNGKWAGVFGYQENINKVSQIESEYQTVTFHGGGGRTGARRKDWISLRPDGSPREHHFGKFNLAFFDTHVEERDTEWSRNVTAKEWLTLVGGSGVAGDKVIKTAANN